jgi:hypothetical protein
MGLNEFLLPADLFTTYVTRIGVTPTVKSSRDLAAENLKEHSVFRSPFLSSPQWHPREP